jgi:hypothetical protein
MAFGPGVTGSPQSMIDQGSGPQFAGDFRQYAGQMAKHYQQRVLNPAKDYWGNGIGWQQANDQRALADWQNQIRGFQQQDAQARQQQPQQQQAPAAPGGDAQPRMMKQTTTTSYDTGTQQTAQSQPQQPQQPAAQAPQFSFAQRLTQLSQPQAFKTQALPAQPMQQAPLPQQTQQPMGFAQSLTADPQKTKRRMGAA